MTSSEKFSLKLNEFHENIGSASNNLRDDTNFTDITLISEDYQQIKAHKVILSSSSPFFMNILKLNKHPNPLIYLKGFKAKDLKSIIDFMYYGSTEVHHENLKTFLSVAEELQLKGLTGDEEHIEIPEAKEHIKSEELNSPPTFFTQKQNHLSNNEFDASPAYNKEYKPNTTATPMAKNNLSDQVSFEGGNAEDLKAVVWSKISQTGRVLTCTVCGKTKDRSTDRDANAHMANHVESIHVNGVTYNCPKCDKTFRSKHALHQHKYKHHK